MNEYGYFPFDRISAIVYVPRLILNGIKWTFFIYVEPMIGAWAESRIEWATHTKMQKLMHAQMHISMQMQRIAFIPIYKRQN